ncbi:drebrin-like protein A isoform X2 [Amphiprion ocellaris]|uniref:drebrin-like protein A isoform X2 n=1 Tax=Amphiprion ocellaris TaxID=80972 RepID=UPI00241174E6|nr:drebrin-like protein A isoform X2 [Amphiprion ocellaris]
MSVNLSKNGAALMAAYKDVVDGKSKKNWALFTYEGNSNDLRLAQTGDGGLEELVEELNSGKVMYAFCRVQDPNSGLPKYVLINWTGEGVKDSRKGICANHVSSIAGFLKGAHVTINARGDEDVEPETILDKVAKASGANFDFHQRKQEYRDAPRGPVGSVYRKTNAVEEIQQINKDDFWGKTQRDEEERRQQENRRAEQQKQQLEKERKEMEEKQAEERERQDLRRTQQIQQDRIQQQQREEDRRKEEQQRRNQVESSKKSTGINSAASVQKANEAKSLVSQRSFNPRDVFRQKEQNPENRRPSPAASRPGKLQSPFLSQKSSERKSVQPRDQLISAPAVTPLTPVSPVSPVSPAAPEEPTRSPEITDSPVQPAEEEEEEEWSDEFDDDGPTPEQTSVQEDLYEAPQSADQEEEDLYENVYQQTPAAEDVPVEAAEQGICARALYDYQAVDDSEITFDPDDIITQIDMLDEGWWRGFGPDGHYGMFPANYVELL